MRSSGSSYFVDVCKAQIHLIIPIMPDIRSTSPVSVMDFYVEHEVRYLWVHNPIVDDDHLTCYDLSDTWDRLDWLIASYPSYYDLESIQRNQRAINMMMTGRNPSAVQHEWVHLLTGEPLTMEVFMATYGVLSHRGRQRPLSDYERALYRARRASSGATDATQESEDEDLAYHFGR